MDKHVSLDVLIITRGRNTVVAYNDLSHFTGEQCLKRIPRNCKEVYNSGCTTSGVYTIDPGCGKSFQVYCDMDSQWEVIQRRMDGSVDFYRNWASYVDGFGDPDGEYWLGLKNIHCLTSRVESTQLKVSLADFDGVKKFATYSFFSVGNAATKYRLNIGGYAGTAGDALARPNGTGFSTFDNDNDKNGNNCAVLFKGGWWYDSCHVANLNGPYLSGSHTSYADGVNWQPFKGYHYSLKYTTMQIRAV